MELRCFTNKSAALIDVCLVTPISKGTVGMKVSAKMGREKFLFHKPCMSSSTQEEETDPSSLPAALWYYTAQQTCSLKSEYLSYWETYPYNKIFHLIKLNPKFSIKNIYMRQRLAFILFYFNYLKKKYDKTNIKITY